LKEHLDRLFKPAFGVVLKTTLRNQADRFSLETGWKVIPVNGRQKEQRPHPLVEILGGTAEQVEFGGCGQEVRAIETGTQLLQ
jgi:hypothetical protein